MSGFAGSLVASTLTEESSPVSGVTSLGSGATGVGGGAVRTSSIFCAPTLLAGGAEAGGVAGPDAVFTGSDVSGLGWATAVTGALVDELLVCGGSAAWCVESGFLAMFALFACSSKYRLSWSASEASSVFLGGMSLAPGAAFGCSSVACVGRFSHRASLGPGVWVNGLGLGLALELCSMRGMMESCNSFGNASPVCANQSMVSLCNQSEVLWRLMLLAPFSSATQNKGVGGIKLCHIITH